MIRIPFITASEVEAQCAAIDLTTAGDTASEMLDLAIESATDLMYALTGRQFGLWADTIRPDLGGEVGTSLSLGKYPVNGVQEVKINGETLPTSAYWVSEDKFILRTNGEAWPATQKQYLADTLDETFSISFSWGISPPLAVRAGTRRLACELLALSVDRPSSLSDRVKSVSRQGTNFDLVSSDDLLSDNGRTGIYEVDLAISAYNSDGNSAPVLVISPDDFSVESGSFGGGRGSTQGPPGEAGVQGVQGIPGDAFWAEHSTVHLTESASTISISGLELAEGVRISVIARSTDTVSSTTDLRLRFSGDSATHYGWVQTGGSNTSNSYLVANQASIGANHIRIGLVSTSITSAVRYGQIDAQSVFVSGLGVPAYVKSTSIAQGGGAVPDTFMTTHGGSWRNPSVTRSIGTISLSLGSGSFVAGTHIVVEVANY
jgi:hypothetical protein